MMEACDDVLTFFFAWCKIVRVMVHGWEGSRKRISEDMSKVKGHVFLCASQSGRWTENTRVPRWSGFATSRCFDCMGQEYRCLFQRAGARFLVMQRKNNKHAPPRHVSEAWPWTLSARIGKRQLAFLRVLVSWILFQLASMVLISPAPVPGQAEDLVGWRIEGDGHKNSNSCQSTLSIFIFDIFWNVDVTLLSCYLVYATLLTTFFYIRRYQKIALHIACNSCFVLTRWCQRLPELFPFADAIIVGPANCVKNMSTNLDIEANISITLLAWTMLWRASGFAAESTWTRLHRQHWHIFLLD